MRFTKGMMIKTANATWYIVEDQVTSKYVRAAARDGFETLIDITSDKIKIIK